MPLAVLATGFVFVLLLSGCGQDGAPVKDDSTSATMSSNAPAAYMKDPVFRQKLDESRLELQAIMAERQTLVDRMEELARAHNNNQTELQQIPEWNDLNKKVIAINKKFEEARARQLRVVRDRLAPNNQKTK